VSEWVECRGQFDVKGDGGRYVGEAEERVANMQAAFVVVLNKIGIVTFVTPAWSIGFVSCYVEHFALSLGVHLSVMLVGLFWN